MDDKKYFIYLSLPNLVFFYFILIIISITNCIYEIPVKVVKIKGNPKYNFTFSKPYKYLKKYNISIFASEGEGIYSNDRLFVGVVKIGSEEKTFNLILDTGSHITWVAKEGSEDQYEIDNKFNPSNSKTCERTTETFVIDYVSGSSSGYYYKDNFKFIDNKKFNIKFGAADKTAINTDLGDGIIGLGHYYDDEPLSFIHSLKKAKVTDSLAFSLKFERGKKSGKLIIGKHDDFSSNKVVTCPLIKYKGMGNIFWGCEINGFGLKKENIEVSSSKTFINILFDTGSNAIFLPLDYFNDVKDSLKKFGCEDVQDNDVYLFVCAASDEDELPSISFKINGNTLFIPGKYCFIQIGQFYYQSLVVFAENSAYVIGSAFYLAFHTLFDKENEKLHFYPSEDGVIKKGTNQFLVMGIIFASIIAVILIVSLIYCIVKRKRNQEVDNDFPSSSFEPLN